MTMSEGELRMLFEYYDIDNCGLIDYEKFIIGIRNQLSEKRLFLVKTAFNKLDIDGTGILNASEIASQYDATGHPDVISGMTSSEFALNSFLETFDVGCIIPGKVTLDEFINYYSNISENMDNDDYFDLMINNVWGINNTNINTQNDYLNNNNNQNNHHYPYFHLYLNNN